MANGLLAQFELVLSGGGQPPLFVEHPRSVKVLAASGMSLTVVSSGMLPMSYQWQKGTNGVFVNLLDSEDLGGSMSAILGMTGVTLNENTDFRVIACNRGDFRRSGSSHE